MLACLSANLINIVLIAVIVLVVGFLIRGMVRDKKAGKSSCGGSCGACSGCSACAKCGSTSSAAAETKGRKPAI